jgi:hypothetical protein
MSSPLVEGIIHLYDEQSNTWAKRWAVVDAACTFRAYKNQMSMLSSKAPAVERSMAKATVTERDLLPGAPTTHGVEIALVMKLSGLPGGVLKLCTDRQADATKWRVAVAEAFGGDAAAGGDVVGDGGGDGGHGRPAALSARPDRAARATTLRETQPPPSSPAPTQQVPPPPPPAMPLPDGAMPPPTSSLTSNRANSNTASSRGSGGSAAADVFGIGASNRTKGAAVRKELTAMYTKYNPSKLDSIPTILTTYDGKWQELFVQLFKKYNITDPVPRFDQHGNTRLDEPPSSPPPGRFPSPTASVSSARPTSVDSKSIARSRRDFSRDGIGSGGDDGGQPVPPRTASATTSKSREPLQKQASFDQADVPAPPPPAALPVAPTPLVVDEKPDFLRSVTPQLKMREDAASSLPPPPAFGGVRDNINVLEHDKSLERERNSQAHDNELSQLQQFMTTKNTAKDELARKLPPTPGGSSGLNQFLASETTTVLQDDKPSHPYRMVFTLDTQHLLGMEGAAHGKDLMNEFAVDLAEQDAKTKKITMFWKVDVDDAAAVRACEEEQEWVAAWVRENKSSNLMEHIGRGCPYAFCTRVRQYAERVTHDEVRLAPFVCAV